MMYKRILVPIDNSIYSDYSKGIGISLAKRLGSSLVGIHVYAALLHSSRFKQMESALPAQYQGKGLKEQRMLHNSLINKGLQMISESYLDVFEKECRHAGVPWDRKTTEGKNYVELVKEIESIGYDLVVMGALGLGAVESSLIGSVCERVVRKVRIDVLVVKNDIPLGGKILAAVDGSPQSFSGIKIALTLGKAFDAKVEAVSAYDPYFHRTAFQGIAEVLSKEAGQVFRFRDQERLHEEIIDKGLAKVYQGHLEAAREMAEKEGTEIKTTLLAGKTYDGVLDYIRKEAPSLLVVGRFGLHKEDGLDIGSTAENLLRLSPCHVLVTGKAFTPMED